MIARQRRVIHGRRLRVDTTRRRDDHPLSDGQRAAGRWRPGSDAHDEAAHRAPGTRPVPRPRSGAQRGASGLRDRATHPHGDPASEPPGPGAQQDADAAALPGSAANHAGRPPAGGDHGARQSLPGPAAPRSDGFVTACARRSAWSGGSWPRPGRGCCAATRTTRTKCSASSNPTPKPSARARRRSRRSSASS